MDKQEALAKAIEWLGSIKSYSREAQDILINTQPNGIGLNQLRDARDKDTRDDQYEIDQQNIRYM